MTSSEGVGWSGIEPVTAPGIHDTSGFTDAAAIPLPTPQELRQWGADFVEGLLRAVVKALAGVFTPDLSAFEQLQSWAADVNSIVADFIESVQQVLNDLLSAIFGGVDFFNLPAPGEFWETAMTSFNPGTIGQNIIADLDASKIVTGVISEARTTISDLRDNLVNGMLGGFNGSGFSNTDANQKATELAQTAMAAASAASAAQEQLAAQEQSQSAGNGTNFRTQFGGSDGANLNSSDWNPYNGNVVIRGSSGFMGVKSGSADGTHSTTCLHACVTDDQMVSMVLGDQGGATGAPLRVLWHLSTNSSTLDGACLSIAKDAVKFGHLSDADVFTQIGPTYSAGIGQGTRIDAYNVGNSFIVKVNGVARISGTDSGGLITLSNKFGAVRMRRQVDTGWFGSSTYDCFRLSSFGLSDYSSVTEIAVDAWKVSRSNTTNVAHAVANGSVALLPTGFFSFTDYVDGASVTTLSTGVVTIATSGLYELSCSIVATATIRQSGATLTTRVATPWALAVNGSQATGAAAAGAPITVHLNAGDTVQPMVAAIGPTLSSTDDPGASGTVIGYEFAIVSVRGFAHFSGRQIGTT